MIRQDGHRASPVFNLQPMYEQLPQDVPQRELVDQILEALPAIAPIAPEMVPDSSLLRKEFLAP